MSELLTIQLAMDLKKHLRSLLKLRGITAAELARRASVPKQSISDWLGGSSPRDIKQVKKVADALGVSVDELCFGEKTESRVIEQITTIDSILGDGWVSGIFEVRFRRVKK